jgi:hypothetical protein
MVLQIPYYSTHFPIQIIHHSSPVTEVCNNLESELGSYNGRLLSSKILWPESFGLDVLDTTIFQPLRYSQLSHIYGSFISYGR